jgi:molybdopterin synthase sulfur carrier subunit|tara:strand:- start:200 stop:436 length:237 start_codon:yes stop_codon:yes gene_type:complete
MDAVLKVLLFASLRERAGWSERSLPWTSACTTPRAIWDRLGLGSLQGISIAVNQQLVDADQPLKAGDELAFLPPFTGG